MSSNLPPLPEPDLLVDCAQSYVRGWTESRLRAYGEACAAAAVAADREQAWVGFEKGKDAAIDAAMADNPSK